MEFFDYRTAPVNGSEVVDLHRTGMSFYDDFLSNNPKTLDYLRTNKNLEGSVVMMTPEEYFKACSDYGFPGSHPSVEALKQQRRADEKIIQHLKNVLTVAKKRFPMPMLNKAEQGQEGLHRMLVIGDMFGWDHKVPVLVVDWADKQRAYEEQKRKRIERIEYNIQKAIHKALRYTYENTEALKDQLQYELDDRFEYSDDIDTPVQFELETNNNKFIVKIGSASVSFDYDEVEFVDSNEDASEDDLDLDVDDDFLKRYFGDDWQEKYPHLKKTFNIKEAYSEQHTVKELDSAIKEAWASPVPGDGCIFISEDGLYINIYPQLDDHEDLCYWLEEEGYGDTPADASWFVDEFMYIRCRNSPHLTFIELPKVVTDEQLQSLELWLATKVSSDNIEVDTPTGDYKRYYLDDYLPEDLVKLIRRYYKSGKLYETFF